LWQLRISALHPALPYVFVSMFLINVPVLCTTMPTVFHVVQHWLWSSAIYGACLPIASVRFLRHLFGRPPKFERTPKDGPDPSVDRTTATSMVILGAASVGLAIYWYSPFTPVLMGLGISYVCVPAYTRLNESSLRGVIARLLVLLPGLFYFYALWEMWRWQGI
jgi:hypothetical protein